MSIYITLCRLKKLGFQPKICESLYVVAPHVVIVVEVLVLHVM